ncbi:MAG: DUF4386 domain-containing protein [Chloroflexota bacterium]
MSENAFRKLAGLFIIVGAILINIPYTLLIMNFEYPDILRAPVAEILTKFHAGGDALIYTWLAFAWVGLPMLFGVIMLKRILEKDAPPFLEMATSIGVIGFAVQVIGLLRWAFVVPVLARLYTDPGTDSATRAAVSAVFVAVHQYGGVILGEHLGQIFTIIWTVTISGILYKSRMFGKWAACLGWIASTIYLLAQTELLATAIPEFPVIDWAGLYGSLLWLLWMIVIGVCLVKYKEPSAS